jgi:hypothetical protein
MGIFDIFKKKEEKYVCSSCGKEHDELPALGFKTPYYYDILSDEDKQNMGNASEDFCIVAHPGQTDFFIRTTMTIPINDSCEDLDYGIWVSVSEKTYDDYEANFKSENSTQTYFGMICNEIRDYDESTLGINANINTRLDGKRPETIPHEGEHNLIKDYQNGITLEEANNRIQKAFKG